MMYNIWLQCVAVCCRVHCRVLQCVAVRCNAMQCVAVRCSVLQCVAVSGSVLQCLAVSCSVVQFVEHVMYNGLTPWMVYVMLSVLQCVAVCCSVLQCGAVCAVCCSVLQFVAALCALCCSALQCAAVCSITDVHYLIPDPILWFVISSRPVVLFFSFVVACCRVCRPSTHGESASHAKTCLLVCMFVCLLAWGCCNLQPIRTHLSPSATKAVAADSPPNKNIYASVYQN